MTAVVWYAHELTIAAGAGFVAFRHHSGALLARFQGDAPLAALAAALTDCLETRRGSWVECGPLRLALSGPTTCAVTNGPLRCETETSYLAELRAWLALGATAPGDTVRLDDEPALSASRTSDGALTLYSPGDGGFAIPLPPEGAARFIAMIETVLGGPSRCEASAAGKDLLDTPWAATLRSDATVVTHPFLGLNGAGGTLGRYVSRVRLATMVQALRQPEPYGFTPGDPCPDCKARPGAPHVSGCDHEHCPLCGLQRMTCGCHTPLPPTLWRGEPMGHAELHELGWFVSLDSASMSWESVAPGTPGAVPDYNRLYCECHWDRGRQRFVRR